LATDFWRTFFGEHFSPFFIASNPSNLSILFKFLFELLCSRPFDLRPRLAYGGEPAKKMTIYCINGI
jgi:hypothetical protein